MAELPGRAPICYKWKEQYTKGVAIYIPRKLKKTQKTNTGSVSKQMTIMKLLDQILKADIHRRKSDPFCRMSIIHFSCCHEVRKHDEWLCMTAYGCQTTLLRNSHLYLLLIKFMYVDMTVSPKRSRTVKYCNFWNEKYISIKIKDLAGYHWW